MSLLLGRQQRDFRLSTIFFALVRFIFTFNDQFSETRRNNKRCRSRDMESKVEKPWKFVGTMEMHKALKLTDATRFDFPNWF